MPAARRPDVQIERVDPASPAARWCVGQYFAELDRRFEGGFDPALGIGRRMLEALEVEARALGFTTVCLETNKALTEAIALYRSAGFREVAPFNDEPYAHYWFEKRLPAG